MQELSVFDTLFQDEKRTYKDLPDGGEALLVDNPFKDARMEIYYRPESAYPYTVSFEGVSQYFVMLSEAFDYADRIYSDEYCLVNFFSQGVSRLRYAVPEEGLDLEGTVMSFALSASLGREALAGIIAALVAKGDCNCRLRSWSGKMDQSILIAL